MKLGMTDMNKEALKKALRDIVKTVSLPHEMEKKGVDVFLIGSRKKAVCPFHGDTDPSLVIYEDDHPHAHCFGCGKHFDVVGFVHEWGEKFEQNWSFKRTLSYFRDTYKISSITNPEEMDNSFLEEEGYTAIVKEDALIRGNYYITSNLIKSALRDSPYPEFDLNKMKPFLRALDESALSSKLSLIEDKEHSLRNFIPKIDDIRYPEELKPFFRYIIGNFEAKIAVVTDHYLVEKIVSSVLNHGKSDSNIMFLIINNKEDRYILPEIISKTQIKKCYIFGEKSYSSIFPKTIKSIDEISGTDKVLELGGKEILIGFRIEKDIKSWVKDVIS